MLDLLCSLSTPACELCSLTARSDILEVTWLLLTVKLGEPVLWSQISGNVFGFNDQCRFSIYFGYAWYFAACPNTLSSGKHLPIHLPGMWFWDLGH